MGVRSAQEYPVEDEFAWVRSGKERQDDPGDVSWPDGMLVKEAFHPVEDGGRVRVSGEARGEFSLPDVLTFDECEHQEGKQLDLVLAELQELRREVAGQLVEAIGTRSVLTCQPNFFKPCRNVSGTNPASRLNISKYERLLRYSYAMTFSFPFPDSTQPITYGVHGRDCTNCVAKVECVVATLPCTRGVTKSFTGQILTLHDEQQTCLITQEYTLNAFRYAPSLLRPVRASTPYVHIEQGNRRMAPESAPTTPAPGAA